MVINDASLAEVLAQLSPAERAAVERLASAPRQAALTPLQRSLLRQIRRRLKHRARAGKRKGKE